MLFNNWLARLFHRHNNDHHLPPGTPADTPMADHLVDLKLPVVSGSDEIRDAVHPSAVTLIAPSQPAPQIPSAPAAIAVATKLPITDCVEFIYSVMNDLYPRLEDEHGDEVNQVILGAIKELRDRYSPDSLNSGIPISYEGGVRQFAYLYLYASVRAGMICRIMQRYSCLASFFNQSHINIGCLGGGPGTDLVGISKYLSANDLYPHISAQICDCHLGWKSSWEAIAQRLPISPSITAQYIEQDFVDPVSWEKTVGDIHADLYTLSYCLPEFHTRQQKAERYFNRVFHDAHKGALFLLVDVNFSTEYDWFERMCRSADIKLLADDRGQERGHSSLELLDPGEERSASHGYKGKWIKTPRTDLHVAYRLGRKM